MAMQNGTNPELGAITHFEHVNLRVPDHRIAHMFFIHGLGFTRDPTRQVGVRNMWVNVGRQQFHLPNGEPASFRGEIGVSVPDLQRARATLAEIADDLADTPFAVAEDDGTLAVISPWGHRLRVHKAGEISGRYPQAISYVRFDVPVGAAAPIAAFYRDMLDTPAAAEGGRATVPVGTQQCFLFTETEDYAPDPHPNHVAVYVTAYQRIYRRFEARGLLMEPDRNEQFRFCRMIDPEGGEDVFAFEHEVRSLYHPDYLKPLVNRVAVPYLVD